MHSQLMRRSLALSLTLLLAACATAPQTTAPEPTSTPQPRQANGLTGLTMQDLVGRFGAPALQIREGNSVKVQFRGPRCVLDAYLYPSGSGALKVTHVDTRLPSGADVDQAACVAGLSSRSS